eukprot:1194608-Prorocentrum_minimum.AAC.2
MCACDSRAFEGGVHVLSDPSEQIDFTLLIVAQAEDAVCRVVKTGVQGKLYTKCRPHNHGDWT